MLGREGREIKLSTIAVLANAKKAGDYHLIMTAQDKTASVMISSPTSMPKIPQHPQHGKLHFATLSGGAANFKVEETNVLAPATVKVKHNLAADCASLSTNPEELENMWLVFHTHLSPTTDHVRSVTESCWDPS